MTSVVAATRTVHPDLLVYFAVAGLVALVFHELAHALVALRLGDHTPKQMGRLTLDPRQHADPFGTWVLPAILLLIIFLAGSPGSFFFAYAKPMPYNPWHTRRATRDTVLIQAAGPLMNVALAFVFGALHSVACGAPALGTFLDVCTAVNLWFAAIHIIPIPPLDCSRAIIPFLPYRAREVFVNMEQYAPLLMILVLFILNFAFVGLVGALARGIGGLIPGSC